ncbi:hypothetical protein SDC9_161454 [bioreactor metagenome]|uniref:Uncharacterized protein n=1 Tax=bioreactor metagenome TaxID=1076179 RepID=A0A645FI99_9ZZZZ
MFRLSWKGDYPDAENFLQLFYSGNLGGANRVGYSNPEYDAMFEQYLKLPPGAERGELVRRMLETVTDAAPWIFESVPVNYHLKHCWFENFYPYDFSYGAWKYITADRRKREETRARFTPLSLDKL